MLVFPSTSHAYIDPGSGMILLQGLRDCLLDNEKNRGLIPLIRVALSKQQNFIEPQTAIGIFAKN
jgi:hypothetical protein